MNNDYRDGACTVSILYKKSGMAGPSRLGHS